MTFRIVDEIDNDQNLNANDKIARYSGYQILVYTARVIDSSLFYIHSFLHPWNYGTTLPAYGLSTVITVTRSTRTCTDLWNVSLSVENAPLWLCMGGRMGIWLHSEGARAEQVACYSQVSTRAKRF